LYYLNINIVSKKKVFISTTLPTTEVNFTIKAKPTKNTEAKPSKSLKSLYYRMEHINLKACMQLANIYGIRLVNTDRFNILNCTECNKCKFKQKINRVSNSSNTIINYLEKVSSDICGPITLKIYNLKKYFITFLDKKTRFFKTKLLDFKTEALTAFKEYRAKIENNNTKSTIINFQTDNGTEYTNTEFQKNLMG
jgi:hypothetical protein